jgi:hypothetical protein
MVLYGRLNFEKKNKMYCSCYFKKKKKRERERTTDSIFPRVFSHSTWHFSWLSSGLATASASVAEACCSTARIQTQTPRERKKKDYHRPVTTFCLNTVKARRLVAHCQCTDMRNYHKSFLFLFPDKNFI